MKFPTLLEYCMHHAKELRSVFELAMNPNYIAFADTIERGNEFYSQPLALWMFIPCGEDGKPLKEPIYYHYYKNGLGNDIQDSSKDIGSPEQWAKDCDEYQAAEQRVLFEGWELAEYGFDMTCAMYVVQYGELTIEFIDDNISNNPSVYEFTNELSIDLTPTQSSINQLNLK